MFKGKQTPIFTLSSEVDPCFLWMWQDRGLPAGRFGGWVGARGDFWAGRGCRRAPGPLCLALSSLVLPLGLPLSLGCRIQAWNFLLHQCWLEGSRSGAEGVGIGQELQPQIRCCWGSRDGGWSFELDFNLNHEDPGFIFEGRFFVVVLFIFIFF